MTEGNAPRDAGDKVAGHNDRIRRLEMRTREPGRQRWLEAIGLGFPVGVANDRTAPVAVAQGGHLVRVRFTADENAGGCTVQVLRNGTVVGSFGVAAGVTVTSVYMPSAPWAAGDVAQAVLTDAAGVKLAVCNLELKG